MSRADRILELERASEGLGSLTTQRDGLQVELARQVAENADLRSRLESCQALAVARDKERADLAQLLNVARESLGQLATRLG